LYKEFIITSAPQLFESLLCGSENVFWVVGLVLSFPLFSFTVADNSPSYLLRDLQSWAVIRDRNRPAAGSFKKTAGSFEVCEIAGTGGSLILQCLEN
jgi:hypothetical protein